MSVNQILQSAPPRPGRVNRAMYKLSGALGLTTGFGVIAWGCWSLIATLGTYFYEETGLATREILIENGLNQGLLLSAVVIGLGVIVLELKTIQALMRERGDQGDATRRQ